MASPRHSSAVENGIRVNYTENGASLLSDNGIHCNDPQPMSNDGLGLKIKAKSYTPQFTTTTSLIISRIHDEGKQKSSLSTDVSTDVLGNATAVGKTESRPTESLTVPLPNNADSRSSTTSPPNHYDIVSSISSSLKRKRNPDVEAPDFSQSTVSFPISAPVATTPSTAAEADSSHPPRTEPPPHHREHPAIESLRENRLSSLGGGIAPAKPELLGFYAGRAPDIARTRYFLKKKRTDLLNVLSFCDQLRPQLLADILVSVSKRHPDLPIFDSPDWEETINRPLDSQVSSSSNGVLPVGRARHGHVILSQKARQRQKTAKKALKRLILAQTQNENTREGIERDGEEEEEDDAEEDVLPPTWPKAGEGLYSKLPPETEDRTLLADDNDDESFSQFMVDKFGKPMIVPTCA